MTKPVSIEDAIYALWDAGVSLATLDDALQEIAFGGESCEDIVRQKTKGDESPKQGKPAQRRKGKAS